MLSPQEILEQLRTIADSWQSMAAAWHVVFGALLLGLAVGWRPSRRLLAGGLALSALSVGVMASLAGNPFNAVVFAALALAMAASARQLPAGSIQTASRPIVAAGIALAAFGLIYPHFSPAASWLTLLIVAPLGLIPCPTLSMLIGITLIARHFDSKAWTALVSGASLFYGLVGVFVLGVRIDVALIAGAFVLALTAMPRRIRIEQRMVKRSALR
jgi:hypothetical protein